MGERFWTQTLRYARAAAQGVIAAALVLPLIFLVARLMRWFGACQ